MPAPDGLTIAYHELRSPLALVVTAARQLLGESEDEEIRFACATIVRASERLLRTATAALELAERPAPARRTLFPPAAPTQELVEDYIALGVPLTLVVESSGRLLWGVREQFEALVAGMVNSAIDHGDLSRPVRVHAAEVHDEFTVEVRNRVAEHEHRGWGLGQGIRELLGFGLGGVVDDRREGDEYVARARIPLAVSVMAA